MIIFLLFFVWSSFFYAAIIALSPKRLMANVENECVCDGLNATAEHLKVVGGRKKNTTQTDITNPDIEEHTRTGGAFLRVAPTQLCKAFKKRRNGKKHLEMRSFLFPPPLFGPLAHFSVNERSFVGIHYECSRI